MQIPEIKTQLPISQVLSHYNLQPDKNNKLNCPFHEEKTPSFQVYEKTNSYHCFGCGKSGDQIQFVEEKEKITKHQAINVCKSLLNVSSDISKTPKEIFPTKQAVPLPLKEVYNELPLVGLDELFTQFQQNLKRSKRGLLTLEERALSIDDLVKQAVPVGYNGRTYKGLINCLVFPLKDKNNRIVSFYGRRIDGTQQKHFYLKNRSGIYPNYPKRDTKILILTESIIDAASLLQNAEITKNHSILSIYGVNGLNTEIQQAIKDWVKFPSTGGVGGGKEIVFAFDEDEAGETAVKKYTKYFVEEHPRLLISKLELPNKDVNETLQLHNQEIFIDLLEKRKVLYKGLSSIENPPKAILSNEKNQSNNKLLKSPNLLKNLSELIGKTGIIGEEGNRLLLFLIAISYKNKKPLHAIVKGESGSGKTHVISGIVDLMPKEDVMRFTRITEASLYNWGRHSLFYKIILIEDLDGLKEEALYALRELMSSGKLSSSVSVKDKDGNNKSAKKEVDGQFSSLSATTKGDVYEDNENRSFTLNVDETSAQTERIIDYQNQRLAGEINKEEEKQIKEDLQNLVRNLQECEVINPYATRLKLPENTKKKRRLNNMYMAIIGQMTFLHQYQRKKKDDKIITTIEDVEMATKLFFETIVLKVDELDGSLREFYENLKVHLLKKGEKEKPFLLREIRQVLTLSKSQVFRYIQSLESLDYIRKTGHANKGYQYQIIYWDDYQKIRKDIKAFMQKQVEALKQQEELKQEEER